jgi:hypothetical protein
MTDVFNVTWFHTMMSELVKALQAQRMCEAISDACRHLSGMGLYQTQFK